MNSINRAQKRSRWLLAYVSGNWDQKRYGEH